VLAALAGLSVGTGAILLITSYGRRDARSGGELSLGPLAENAGLWWTGRF
jgi:hypothetical protein